MEAAERRQPLQARERPLRAPGSVEESRKKAAAKSGSIDPGAGENGFGGAERRNVRRS